MICEWCWTKAKRRVEGDPAAFGHNSVTEEYANVVRAEEEKGITTECPEFRAKLNAAREGHSFPNIPGGK